MKPGDKSAGANCWRERSIQIAGLQGLIVISLGLNLLGTSCVSKSKAQAQARAAYLAGQQAALAKMTQSAIVTFIGPVKNPTVPWTERLTLAKAILSAVYIPRGEPTLIMIVREGQAIPIDSSRLLSGEDIPLLAGDLVQLGQ